MTCKRALLSTTKLSMAAFLVAGMAAAPVAFGPGSVLQSNPAVAQAASDDEGFAEERVERQLDPQRVGAEDNVYETLGTTREQAEGAADQMATAQYGQLDTYQAEVERNNLDGAATTLAVIARRPITEAMVVDVNRELGVETDLTAQQIAAAAASVQESSGQRSEVDGAVIIVTDPSVVAVPVETGTRAAVDYDADSVYELLGTTREEAEQADTHTAASAQYGQLDAYQTAVERGNLDAAADNLAAISERPITEKLVTDVNRELGVETRLTAQQIADVAARKQQAEVPD